LVGFFCPKVDKFCVITLDDQLWPSISCSSQLGFAHYFCSHH
jgi:hypothetical protein